MRAETEWCDYDVIVVGSGGAGSSAAHAAAAEGARVLVVAKDPIGCSDSKIAEGIVTVRASAEADDTEEALAENLRIAGADLPDPEITAAFARDTETGYDWLRRHGARPDMDSARGKPKTLPIPLGGHTRRRSIGHQNGGLALGHANWNAVVQGERIDYREDTWFLDIVTDDQRSGKTVIGGVAYDAGRGCFVAIRAPSVVIASGGLSTIYFPNTDTMRGNTGDSYALGLRAGAQLIDMEQVQFLPFCMTHPPAYEGLLAGEPATAGFLGVLRDKNGKIILDGVMLRTRAECSAAMVEAVQAGKGTERGGCYLDLTGNMKLPKSGVYYDHFLQTSLSGVMATVRQAWGRKAAKCEEMWEVRPGAHYLMGGIRVDPHGAAVLGDQGQGIAGLFAAGQAMGGVFGANRLGSTSLAEGPIFGIRAGRAAGARASRATRQAKAADSRFAQVLAPYRDVLGRAGPEAPGLMVRELQGACWAAIGPGRTEAGLTEFLDMVAAMRRRLEKVQIPADGLYNQPFIDFVELRNMLDCAEAVAVSALARDHSLGAHVRLDKPTASMIWANPFSVALRRSPEGGLAVTRLVRAKTPLKTLIPHRLRDTKRKIWLKILRALPAARQDAILEKRYRAVMGDMTRPEPAADAAESAAA